LLANILPTSKHSNMGCCSRAQQACIQNLLKKQPKVTIEDVTDSDDVSDSESESRFDCKDSEDEDDLMDLKDKLNDEESVEVKNDAKLLTFIKRDKQLQLQQKGYKKPRATGQNITIRKSTRTQKRIWQTQQNMEKTEQKFI
jgi:hypothetical protein